MTTFTLTGLQAAYVVGALRIALDGHHALAEHDRMIMENIMYELSAPMNLDDEVTKILDNPSIRLKVSGAAWSKGGVVLDSGTRFRFIYKQTHHEGAIIDGFWSLGEERFHTPNQMIKRLVQQTGSGKEAVINAWHSIDVMIPFSNEWVRLNNFRKRISRRGMQKF